MFILAQILGAIGLLGIVVGIQQKSKDKVLLIYLIVNVIFTAQYFCLGAYVGAAIYIVNTIRTGVFYYYKKKDMKPSYWVLMLFIVSAIVSGAITWQNIYSIIPVAVTVFYTYSIWQDNVKIIRIGTLTVAAGWLVYNLIVMAYSGAAAELVHFISAIVAMVRFDLLKKGNKESEVKDV